MKELTLLYVTCPNADEAKVIACTLVGDCLVAYANILGFMTSIHRWDGEVAEQEEVAMLSKTRREVTVHMAERVKSSHSHDLSWVISLPIQGGNPDIMDWLHREVD